MICESMVDNTALGHAADRGSRAKGDAGVHRGLEGLCMVDTGISSDHRFPRAQYSILCSLGESRLAGVALRVDSSSCTAHEPQLVVSK